MRLRILSDDEIEARYGRPRFTHEERVEYFSLSPAEKAALEQLRLINAKIHFILQLGYFKASMMFFDVEPQDVKEDVQFIRERYFPEHHDSDLGISKVTRLKQQRVILKLGNYRDWNARQKAMLEGRARQAATVCGKPLYVLRELIGQVPPPPDQLKDETVTRATTSRSAIRWTYSTCTPCSIAHVLPVTLRTFYS